MLTVDLARPSISNRLPFLPTLLAVALAFSSAAAAQKPVMCHAMGTQDEIPPDKLPVPEILTGIGNAHIKITATPEAQMWFDQGLNLNHDFWDYESARAFEQSVRVDPNCAMCYWGLYLALSMRSSEDPYAADALKKAVALKNHAGKNERLYIEAADAGSESAKNKKDEDDGDSAEIKILRKLVKRSPNDLQAKIFLAEALNDGYDHDGNAKKGMKETLSLLQAVLKADPENSAANHYWIHAVEASPKPEQALHSAEILGRLAPTSGHMVHMPGHIFFRTGDYATAEKSFTASTVADETYMQALHVGVDDDWNYVHNLMYAIANLMEEGRLADATQLSAKLKGARGESSATLYIGSPRDGIARIDPRLPVALRAADWPRVLEMLKAAPAPPAPLTNLAFLSASLTDFAAGMLALESHDVAQAEDFSRRLDSQLWRASEQVKEEDAAKEKEKKNDGDKKKDDDKKKLKIMPDANAKPLVSNLSIMSLELRAGILIEKKQIDEAKKLYSQATGEEKDLGYREPPACIRPVSETQAAALLAVSDYPAAKAAYQQALIERPKSGYPLYGLALTEEKSGNPQAASTAYSAFLSAWSAADPNLPQIAHAKSYVDAHTVAAYMECGAPAPPLQSNRSCPNDRPFTK
jgi:tetratricopeptide (TPR) repeat protein